MGRFVPTPLPIHTTATPPISPPPNPTGVKPAISTTTLSDFISSWEAGSAADYVFDAPLPVICPDLLEQWRCVASEGEQQTRR